FALVFVAAQLALDGDVSTLCESAGEVSQLPEGDASMPLGPRFPASGVILPGRFGGEREHRNVGCVADLLFGIAAEETDERVILLRYIRFSCSARLSRAPGSEWARLPRPEAAFLGGPARGSQNRNGAAGKAEASPAPGAARAPKLCRDRGRNRKRT